MLGDKVKLLRKEIDNNTTNNEVYDDNIKIIERARKKMDPKNKEKMMKILRCAFDEYFDY